MSTEAHYKSRGKAWAAAAAAVGIDPSDVPLCGARDGSVAATTAEITCPDCLSLRSRLADDPEGVAKIAAARWNGAALGAAAAAANGRPAGGEPGSPPTATPPSDMALVMVGTMPVALADIIATLTTGGKMRVPCPPIEARVGWARSLLAAAEESEALAAILNGSTFQIVMLLAGLATIIRPVRVTVDEDAETPTISATDIDRSWEKTFG